MITRAVAAGLRSEYSETYPLQKWQRQALKAAGLLPQPVARAAISRYQTLSGLPPDRLKHLSIESLAAERLADYHGLHGRYPAVALGAALGGAAAHLALALGGPFLPQAFVTTLRGGSPTGDIHAYVQRSADLACEVASANPCLVTIQHYDPVHDGWLTRYVNHLRFKLIDLPQAYIDFIRQRLEPGGAVCYLDCRAKWLRYRVGERSFVQVGGWGDISAREFLEGSGRLRRYCRTAGLRRCDWKLPDYPLEEGPESEWGSEPGLGAALADFCRQEGYRFVRLSLPEPHDFSKLAFLAVRRLLEKEGREPAGVLIEMFTQFDATAVLRGGLLPLWLVFNTLDSLAFLERMVPLFPTGLPVFFSPLATFSDTPDLVSWAEWEKALNRFDWRNIGARPSHYPADPLALVSWAEPLRRWVGENGHPLRQRLVVEELQDIISHGL